MSTRTRIRGFGRAGLLLIVFSVLALGATAFAALGDDETSVAADQQQMKATKRSVQKEVNYTVHEIETPSGTIVREYVSPAGKVFGVAWRGPFLPDFAQILGTYNDQFVQAAQASRQGKSVAARRAPLNVEQPNLVVRSAGHMRAYVGQAYVPDLLPDGVSIQDIK